MEKHPSNSLTYIACLPAENIKYLAEFRHIEELKIAVDENEIWIKNLTADHINQKELLTAPKIQIFELKDQLLFRPNHKIPFQKMKLGLLWAPINTAINVTLPISNSNFFGIPDKINVRLIPDFNEQSSIGTYTSIDELNNYIKTTSRIRLKPIVWVIVNDAALLLGTPLLPILGKSYWKLNDFIIPCGFNLEFPVFAAQICELLKNGSDCFIFWPNEHYFIKIPKSNFTNLSLVSVNKTINLCKHKF